MTIKNVNTQALNQVLEILRDLSMDVMYNDDMEPTERVIEIQKIGKDSARIAELGVLCTVSAAQSNVIRYNKLTTELENLTTPFLAGSGVSILEDL